MTVFSPDPQVNPGWVSEPVTTTEPLQTNYSHPTATPSGQNNGVQAEEPMQELNMPADELEILKRLGYSYQVLASAIVRAKQAQQDLRTQLNYHKEAIGICQQELQTVLAQFVAHQANPQTMPANEEEIAAEFAELKDLLKGTHHESLLKKLNQMQAAVDADRQNLPEVLQAMRSELDLVILQALRLTALENLNNAYKKHRQFQEYNQRAEQEFQSLVKAFTLN
jgi:hypothetical protein